MIARSESNAHESRATRFQPTETLRNFINHQSQREQRCYLFFTPVPELLCLPDPTIFLLYYGFNKIRSGR